MGNAFSPSQHGFHFPNSFPDEPDLTIRIPLLGSIPIGNAANGLCGGMIYAALDYFLAGNLISHRTTVPAPDDPLFKYIVRRLQDSFDIPFGVMKYYTWMAHAGDLVQRTITDELPLIETGLQDGPVPIGLIRSQSHNPMDLGKNHQVLVCGITRNGDTSALRIYDCNYPDNDEVSIDCNGTTLIHSLDGALRGLFTTKYMARVPDP